MRRVLLVIAMLCGVFCPVALVGQEPEAVGTHGLALKYPGDRGLSRDPAVLLFEDFDGLPLTGITGRWEAVSNEKDAVLALSEDVPAHSGGKGRQSLQVTGHPGRDSGGHLYQRLPRGVDELFLRFYVKFPEPVSYIHHFVQIGGYNPSTVWPQGHAGERPRGDNRVTAGIEPFGRNGKLSPPGDWNFYVYWHEMKVSARNEYWGNGLTPAIPQIVPVNRWQCVEVRMKLNAPGQSDGVLALWLDGRPAGDFQKGARRAAWTGMGFQLRPDDQPGEPFEGFNFRTTPDLKLNYVLLQNYVTETNQRRNRVADPSRPAVVLFDQVVVATQYIGPIALEK